MIEKKDCIAALLRVPSQAIHWMHVKACIAPEPWSLYQRDDGLRVLPRRPRQFIERLA